MTLKTSVKARPMNPETDLHFILSSWLQSYQRSDFAKAIPPKIYFEYHQLLLSQILKHPTNSVTVLCDPEHVDQIIGYVVYSTKKPIIYYTYVKYPFRKLGLGAILLAGVRENFSPSDSITCTHKMGHWSQLAKKYNLVYNPYITSVYEEPAIES